MDGIPIVRQYMVKEKLALKADDSIYEVFDKFIQKGFSGAPVVDKDNKLIGILTQKDCLRVITNFALYRQSEGGIVKDYMSPVKAIITPDMDLFKVAEVFLETNFVALPVLDENKLIGRIHRKDILKAFSEWQKKRAQKLAEEEMARSRLDRPTSIEQMQKTVGSHKKGQITSIFKGQ